MNDTTNGHKSASQELEEAAKKYRMEVYAAIENMADFADWKHNLPCVEWLIPGLIPARAMVQISGAPKAGKSWLMLAMVKAFTEGGFFLSYRLPQLSPLWYFAETDTYTAKAQMDEMGFDPHPAMLMGQSINELPAFGPDLFCDALVNAYETALKADNEPKIIFIDTLGRWMKNTRENGWNGYAGSLDVMDPLTQAASFFKTHGTTLVVIHHSGKGSGKSPSEAGIGSQGIGGTFDTNILLRKTETDRRKLEIESRFGLGELGEQINFEWNGSQIVVTNLAADMELEILDAIESGADTIKAMAESLDDEHSYRSILNRTRNMVKAGTLTVTGKGKATRYTLAESRIA